MNTPKVKLIIHSEEMEHKKYESIVKAIKDITVLRKGLKYTRDNRKLFISRRKGEPKVLFIKRIIELEHSQTEP